MQVFLHIGSDKTGSTSIQSALFRNRDWLRERSVYVPNTGFGWDNGHSALLTKLDDRDLASLKQELALATDSGFKSAVLSWEGMVYFRWHRIRKLFRILRPFDIQILVYLRDQAEFIQSAHLQLIKMGNRVPSIRALAAPAGLRQHLLAAAFIRDPSCNYYRKLRRWRRWMPGASFCVRVFDRSRLAGGDVVTDFLQQLGVEKDSTFAPAETQSNPSLDVEGALLVDDWRASPDHRDHLRTLIDVTQSVINHEGSQTRYFLDEASVRALRKHYARGNRRLADRFPTEGDCLFPPERACWRTDSLSEIEARSRQLSKRVAQVNRVPTLPGSAHGSAIAAHADLYEGWSGPESWGVWSVGPCSRLRFRLPARLFVVGVPTLAITLRGRYRAGVESSEVTINGINMGTQDLSAAQTCMTLPVDALEPYQVVSICLEHASSSAHAPGDYKRDLAFALSDIAVTPKQ